MAADVSTIPKAKSEHELCTCSEPLLTEHTCGDLLHRTEGPNPSPRPIRTPSQKGDPVIIRVGFPHKCDVCGDTFATKNALLRHRLAHTDNMLEECKTSCKSFSKKRGSLKTIPRGDGVETFVCKLCGRIFPRKELRDKHRLTHTGKRPYRCEVCNRGFTQSGNLNAHLRTHTGEKPFKCDVCEKYYTTKAILRNHLNLHIKGKLK